MQLYWNDPHFLLNLLFQCWPALPALPCTCSQPHYHWIYECHHNHVETTTAIWEFDPTLPQNWVLGGLLDIVATIWTLAIKIQASGQCITYFKHLQNECGMDIALKIPLHSNIQWGTADGMLAQSYDLWTVCLTLALDPNKDWSEIQPINLFISLADELFGSITSIQQLGQPIKHTLWTAFTIKAPDWEHVNDMQTIVSNTNSIQHLFLYNDQPAVWCAIPTFEELQTTWEEKHDLHKYALYKDALNHTLQKLNKYYNKFDDKSVYILALGKYSNLLVTVIYWHWLWCSIAPVLLQTNIHWDGLGWCWRTEEGTWSWQPQCQRLV